MPPEIAKEWIEKAEEDYGFACANLDGTDYFAQICFHFQQAAEKYFKAFIISLNCSKFVNSMVQTLKKLNLHVAILTLSI